MKPYLLDCTLRDGGYINDWEFGRDNIINIFERVVASGVEWIEIGFLDERRPFDPNRTIMPDTSCVEKIFGRLDKGGARVLGMIDFGTCSLDRLQPCAESFLDGIRVIFKKQNLRPAMAFCAQVKALGYQVFAQLVSVTSYSDEELLEVAALANEVRPYAVSMVDTYGLINPEELKHISGILDRALSPEIVLGFHAHNNFQLGFANATTVLNLDTERNVLVDGTLYGMGKSAGNAPLELVAMYMNEHCGKRYAVTELQEAITVSVVDFQRRSPWGYQLFYYIAAANRVHPNYVSWLMNKQTLSVTAINVILSRIPEDQKLEKNVTLIERLYLDYQKRSCDDSEALERLRTALSGRAALILGPGKTISTCAEQIHNWIAAQRPAVISINYVPEQFSPEFVFLTNAKRFVQTESHLLEPQNQNVQVIATSNLTPNKRSFGYTINYADLIDEAAEFPDNSMCMLLRLLLRCGCREAGLAGLDGYTPDGVNYFDENKAYDFLREKAGSLNNYARSFFDSISDRINVRFVTPSEYQKRGEL